MHIMLTVTTQRTVTSGLYCTLKWLFLYFAKQSVLIVKGIY